MFSQILKVHSAGGRSSVTVISALPSERNLCLPEPSKPELICVSPTKVGLYFCRHEIEIAACAS
jgi:hypothetical protein